MPGSSSDEPPEHGRVKDRPGGQAAWGSPSPHHEPAPRPRPLHEKFGFKREEQGMQARQVAVSLMVGLFMLPGLLGAEARPPAHLEKAKQHARQAIRHVDEGDFSEAVEDFKKAYDLAALPHYLYNIARAYQVMGQNGEAIRYYERYLQFIEEEGERKAVRDEIAALQERLATLVVEVEPADAQLRVDADPERCQIGKPCFLDPGKHIVEWLQK